MNFNRENSISIKLQSQDILRWKNFEIRKRPPKLNVDVVDDTNQCNLIGAADWRVQLVDFSFHCSAQSIAFSKLYRTSHSLNFPIISCQNARADLESQIKKKKIENFYFASSRTVVFKKTYHFDIKVNLVPSAGSLRFV